MRVGYRIFAGPGGNEPRIPGVTPRCEHGIEILVVLAFLVYIIGISLDKGCAVLSFFCQLPLVKSQADALLRQLAQHWEGELYDAAKRAAADGRLGAQGRTLRVDKLESRLCDLCLPYQRSITPDMKPHECDFANLIDELLGLFVDEELFTFVLVPGVEPTNNTTERLLRAPAQDRKAGRNNQTAVGAHRRSVIVSVLESLRANLEIFNLASVLQEVGRMIVMAGEFGRTPRVFGLPRFYTLPGRDHRGAVQTVFFAGGAVKGGAVVGSSLTWSHLEGTRLS